MEITRFVDLNQRNALAEARAKYGDVRELSVSAEELNELAIVCNKFCRYNSKESAQKALHDSVVTEVADVLIILDHVVNIFELTPIEIEDAIEGKIERLKRWLRQSSDLEISTKDREIPGQQELHIRNCPACKHIWNFDNLKLGGRCLRCHQGESLFEPKEDKNETE